MQPNYFVAFLLPYMKTCLFCHIKLVSFFLSGSNTSSHPTPSSTQSNNSSAHNKRPSTAELKIRWEQHESFAPPTHQAQPQQRTVIEYAEVCMCAELRISLTVDFSFLSFPWPPEVAQHVFFLSPGR